MAGRLSRTILLLAGLLVLTLGRCELRRRGDDRTAVVRDA